MRYIPLKPPLPGSKYYTDYIEFVKKADDLLVELRAAPTAQARNDIIDQNKALWGKLKDWLLSLSYGKCWFSEAKDCFQYWDVEHFRPKKTAKDLDGTQHEGYWWLTFQWQNYRICGKVGNTKKGTFFPLRDGCNRISNPDGDMRFEDPLLLDPSDEDDPLLLSFNVDGRAVPNPSITDEWERLRVTYSVERYNLDFPPLMDKRKVIWNECWQHIQKYIDELGKYQRDRSNVIAKEGFKREAGNIRKLINADQELSAVARACILSTGDSRLRNLLQSV